MKRPAMKRSPQQEDGTFAKKHRRLPPLSETACPDEHVFISLDGYDAKVKTLFDKEGMKRPAMKRPAMKTPAKSEVGTPAKKLRILPPLNKAADPQNHVFLSLTDCDKKLDKLFEGDNDFVFIRGGVATGKTTLAAHLARQFPNKYIMVPFTGAGEESAWEMGTVDAIAEATNQTIKNDLAFRNALILAAERKLTLVYDEAHTLFASQELCTALFKSSDGYRPKVLLFSASGEASSKQQLVATPVEISQKFMWTAPFSYTTDLGDQLKAAGVWLDKESIEFFIHFCGGHRGIFIAAMHWVQSKQRRGESWSLTTTVGSVRNSHGNGDWDCTDAEILGALKKSRAVKVNGQYSAVENTPKEFVELLCGGARPIRQDMRKELAISGFVLPKCDSEEEFQELNWTNDDLRYRVANPLQALYYRFQLKKSCGLEVQFEQSEPQGCADLLMRALPYMLFSKVVSFEAGKSELAKDCLPHEQQYNLAIHSVLQDMGYSTLAPEASETGKGKPDLVVKIGAETFIIELARSKIPQHLKRFQDLKDYKIASHKGLCIIGNNKETMLQTVKKTDGRDVQIIGLVPNIAHTAYTVHVKSKGIEPINTFRVDCDLVARRLVLKDDGEPELYSVQSLKSVNLSPKAQSRRWVRSLVGWFFFCLSPFSASVFRK